MIYRSTKSIQYMLYRTRGTFALYLKFNKLLCFLVMLKIVQRYIDKICSVKVASIFLVPTQPF